MEEYMKRVIWVVIAIGFLVVSCGGGNINKVKNGMFSNYDKTITVGKALENNKILKGGKWKEINMNGRDYVTYTVNLTSSQAEELMTEALSITSYKNKPNFGKVFAFYNNLIKWGNVAYLDGDISKLTTMSFEEINSAVYNIKPEVLGPSQSDYDWEGYNMAYYQWQKAHENDIEKMITIDGCEITLSFVMNQDGSFTTNMV